MGESEEPAIEDEDSAYFWTARGLAPLGAVKPASQVLQDNERGKGEGEQRRVD
jgi:hypothetical protein